MLPLQEEHWFMSAAIIPYWYTPQFFLFIHSKPLLDPSLQPLIHLILTYSCALKHQSLLRRSTHNRIKFIKRDAQSCMHRHRPTGCPSLLLQLTNKRIISYVLSVLALMSGQLTISIYRPNFVSGYFKPLFYYSVNYSRRTRNQAGFIEPRKKINTFGI